MAISVTHHISLKVKIVPEDSQSPTLGTGDASFESSCMYAACWGIASNSFTLDSLCCFWELILGFIYSCLLSFELSITAICWPGGLPHLFLSSFFLLFHALCLPKSLNSGCLTLKPFLFLL